MKKVLAFLFCVLVSLCPLSADAEAADKELAITYVKSPLNIPSILEKRLGLLEAEFGPLGYAVSHYRSKFIKLTPTERTKYICVKT